jgi:hypothetical protein
MVVPSEKFTEPIPHPVKSRAVIGDLYPHSVPVGISNSNKDRRSRPMTVGILKEIPEDTRHRPAIGEDTPLPLDPNCNLRYLRCRLLNQLSD